MAFSKIEKNDKLSPIQLIYACLMMVVVFSGIYYWQTRSTENEIKDCANKELISKGYSVIEVSVLEAKMRFKGSAANGKVKFTVKDKNGVLLIGTAAVGESGGGCGGRKMIFNISEIKPENGGVTP